MNLVFLSTSRWDFDVATPFERPLGGSESALSYLAVELGQRGHSVTLLTGTTRPRTAMGVNCLTEGQQPRAFYGQPFDAFVVQSGPADGARRLRPALAPSTPLILWTGHAPDQPAIQGLRDRANQEAWDAIVGVSDWHRRAMIDHFGLDPARVLVLRNAIAPAFQNLFSDQEALLQAKRSTPLLTYTSTPFRGLDVLLDTFAELRKEFTQAELHVFSSMKVYQQDEAHDAFAPLYDRCRTTLGVKYCGSILQPELAKALRAIPILAYPNTFAETSCIAVLEAMAAGLFVVTTDLGALAETTQGFAALVPPGRERTAFVASYLARLKEVLHQRAADPQAFAAVCMAQVKAINAGWTWRVRAREWEEALGSIRETKGRESWECFRDSIMTFGMLLVVDELRVIGHAINWRLNGPCEHIAPRELSEGDRQSLRILFNEVCSQQRFCQFGGKSVLIEVRESYSCSDGRMELPSASFSLIRDAVAAFLGELQHSPTELEVLTGLPASVSSGLLTRMQAAR